MRVHVVSDVHGNVDALARAGESADALVVLGDLLDLVDYQDFSRGILGAVFGPDAVARFAELRSSGAPGDAGAYARSLWAGLDDAQTVLTEAVRAQYRRLFAALSAPTYATPGNVDVPGLWPEFARDGVHVLDGGVAEIGGRRFGFVGGGLIPDGLVRPPRRRDPWVPYLRTGQEFGAAVDRLTAVDVLCSHVPPAVPELVYDVRARRAEFGSPHLLSLIHRQRPGHALFGHVHQPLARRARVGYTECVNVGYFRSTGTPHVLQW
ncbi:MAG: metallophosphoesterase [Actinomycetota bacterium]|nr:metallophosphoesterase [Actinomycetota bacterium]